MFEVWRNHVAVYYNNISTILNYFVKYFIYKTSLIICFSGMYFNNPLIQPTIAQIDQSFGATHPGGETF